MCTVRLQIRIQAAESRVLGACTRLEQTSQMGSCLFCGDGVQRNEEQAQQSTSHCYNSFGVGHFRRDSLECGRSLGLAALTWILQVGCVLAVRSSDCPCAAYDPVATNGSQH